MIRYLSSMLDNSMTLDWEEQLPAMMMAYNCHVQRATHETPFFLTYLHSPRLPYFDLKKPRLLYREDWSSLAFAKMQNAFKQVRSNLESAREVRENYFNKKTKECIFKVVIVFWINSQIIPEELIRNFTKNGKECFGLQRLWEKSI